MPAFFNLGILPFVLRVLFFIGVLFFFFGGCCDKATPKLVQVNTTHEDSISSTAKGISKDLNYVEYPRPSDFVDIIQNRITSGQNDDTSYVIYPYETGDIK